MREASTLDIQSRPLLRFRLLRPIMLLMVFACVFFIVRRKTLHRIDRFRGIDQLNAILRLAPNLPT